MRCVRYDMWSSVGRRFSGNCPVPVVEGEDSVVVNVKAASLNPVDYKLPKVVMHGKGIGLDCAGVVTQVSKDVKHIKVGDRVFGTTRGSLAEFALCKASHLAKLPEQLSFQQGAALPTAYLSAYQAYKDHGFQPGMKVLVIGASGGCGSAGVQIAKAMGASQVTGVCSKKNEELVKSLGADSIIDYTSQKLPQAAGKDAFDFCYDTASFSGGNENYIADARRVLKSGDAPGQGMYVTLNSNVLNWLRYFTSSQSKKVSLLLTKHSSADLDAIAQLMTEPGKPAKFLPILEEKQYELTEKGVEQAFEHLTSRRARGKIIVNI